MMTVRAGAAIGTTPTAFWILLVAGLACRSPGSGSADGGGDAAAPTCNDDEKNGAETDVDCGGGTCDRCGAGMRCNALGDCASWLICGSDSACVEPPRAWSPEVAVDIAAEGELARYETAERIVEDAAGRPVLAFAQENTAGSQLRLYGRAYLSGAWGAEALLDPAPNDPGHQYRSNVPVTADGQTFIPLDHLECCDAKEFHIARWDGTIFHPAVKVSTAATEDDYLASEGTTAVAMWEQHTSGPTRIFTSHWNGTGFTAAEPVDANADHDAVIDASQNFLWEPGTDRWGGWLLWNQYDGAAERLYARRFLGAWGTTTAIDANIDPGLPDNVYNAVSDHDGKVVVGFWQSDADGVNRAWVNGSDGTDWSGATRLQVENTVAEEGFPSLYSLNGTAGDVIAVWSEDSGFLGGSARWKLRARRYSGGSWSAEAVVYQGPTAVYDLAFASPAAGKGVLCVKANVDGHQRIYLAAFDGSAWQSPHLVPLPQGATDSNACNLAADGAGSVIALVWSYDAVPGGGEWRTAVRWDGSAFGAGAPIIENAGWVSGQSPALQVRPGKLFVFYVLGDHLFATEWKDGTWQAAVRLDAGSYAVDFGFKAYPLSGGRAVVLYRQAEDPRERLKARVYE